MFAMANTVKQEFMREDFQDLGAIPPPFLIAEGMPPFFKARLEVARRRSLRS